MKEKINRFLYTSRLANVFSIPIILGILLWMVSSIFFVYYPNIHFFGYFFFILGLFVFGSSGVIMIFRRESFMPFFRTGVKAVICGYYTVFLFWGSAIAFLILCLAN
ncbi:MAG: hypothetical protein C0410_07555 [Anaerolinea sp.]|nr:hypothetical protein [Anaerolinea sp.]